MGPEAATPMDMGELVEEFLLRLPPDDPMSLVRAALVCRLWCGVLDDPGFRRRFTELHRTPPLLGFFHRRRGQSARFTPTSSFRPRDADLRERAVFDSRHGRVLITSLPLYCHITGRLSIWDPVTGEVVELPSPPPQPVIWSSWNATVLCAAAAGACDHLDCRRGPCLVVVVGTTSNSVVVCVYSSESGRWSRYAAQPPGGRYIYLRHLEHGALVGNAIYFTFYNRFGIGILGYDLGTQKMSSFSLPRSCIYDGQRVVLTENAGLLGFASVEDSRLCLWSLQPGLNGRWAWARVRAIELKAMLPTDARFVSPRLRVIGFARGLDVFFLRTPGGLFSVDLKAGVGRKVCKGGGILNVFPYMSFCIPGAEESDTSSDSSDEEASADETDEDW